MRMQRAKEAKGKTFSAFQGISLCDFCQENNSGLWKLEVMRQGFWEAISKDDGKVLG